VKGINMKNILTAIAMTAALAAPAYANKTEIPPAQHFVEMWNKDPEDKKRRMVFSEEILVVQPGDLIQFVATDKGHNVEFIDGPDGVELPKKSKISDDVMITLDEPGVYVYVCTPHASMGMIGVVVVGDLTQEGVDAVKDAKLRGKSKKKFKELLKELP
jgi:pseudoazurin